MDFQHLRFLGLLFCLNATQFGVDFVYSIPFGSTIFDFSFFAKTIMESALFGPLIGVIIQILFGAWRI